METENTTFEYDGVDYETLAEALQAARSGLVWPELWHTGFVGVDASGRKRFCYALFPRWKFLGNEVTSETPFILHKAPNNDITAFETYMARYTVFFAIDVIDISAANE